MRFLITGVSGFAGTALAQHLLAGGHTVFGTTRNRDGIAVARSPLAADHIFAAPLEDAPRLAAVINGTAPDGIFHLAAFTNPAASFNDPGAAYRANLHGSLNMFAAVCSLKNPCRLVWVGSSDVYGLVEPRELPVTESNIFRPLSPYAVSKAAADLAAYQWSRAHGINVVRMRPFNHTGPGQDAQYVCADFARQVIAIERRNRRGHIEVGNLDVTRDFSDVRDVVHAYALAWERGSSGEAYNVCSGVPRTAREILETLITLSGIDATIAVRAERQRRVDVPLLVGSAVKLHAATGWTPKISWDQTLRDLLADWRARLP